MPPLALALDGDRGVTITRRFAAPPAALFRAHTEAALMQRWMLGPPGWTMPVCISEPWPEGRLRCEWTDGTAGFQLTGIYLELDPPRLIRHVERMHLPEPTADNHVETRFEAAGGGTRMTLRMLLPDAAARAAMLRSGMEVGMEQSYARIDPLLRGKGAAD
ncbi:MAG: SRPBCC domain-containing protein [Rhodobacteraceae bacterium]|jgi:uncharacterized protein YndB with AHSA1/START domain|nr:SRPBCC domain-containing protein [Paracoccaceae bacterium]